MPNYYDEVMVERAISVQGRVDVAELATLAIYLERKGFAVRSMSNLINMSIQLAFRAVVNSEEVAVCDSATEASNYLYERGLVQRATMRRGMAKIATAVGFENLRSEGYEPAGEAPSRYREVHNRSNRTYNKRDRYDPRHLTEEELEKKAKQLEDRERRQRAIHEVLAKMPSTSVSDSEGQDSEDASESGSD